MLRHEVSRVQSIGNILLEGLKHLFECRAAAADQFTYLCIELFEPEPRESRCCDGIYRLADCDIHAHRTADDPPDVLSKHGRRIFKSCRTGGFPPGHYIARQVCHAADETIGSHGEVEEMIVHHGGQLIDQENLVLLDESAEHHVLARQHSQLILNLLLGY